MPGNFARFTQRNFVAYFLRQKSTFIRKAVTVRFLGPFGFTGYIRSLAGGLA